MEIESLPLAGRINQEMRAFALGAGRRRSLPSTVHVGVPLGEQRSVPVEEWYDATVRADLVERALDGIAEDGPLAVWLTRAGDPAATAHDHDWLVAARTAFGRHGREPAGVFVLTRRGWVDLVTGKAHVWTRLRPTG